MSLRPQSATTYALLGPTTVAAPMYTETQQKGTDVFFYDREMSWGGSMTRRTVFATRNGVPATSSAEDARRGETG
jgi:hypothetical protein